jgi:hypothetical protein
MIGADFDYGCTLGSSMFFYEAQRSGKLPADNPVKWRGSAGLKDTAPNGNSIAGGWWVARARVCGVREQSRLCRQRRMRPAAAD